MTAATIRPDDEYRKPSLIMWEVSVLELHESDVSPIVIGGIMSLP